MSLLADESTRPPITTAGPLGVFAAGPTSVSVSRSDTPAFALAYVRNAHEPAVRWPPVNGGSWPVITVQNNLRWQLSSRMKGRLLADC